MHLSLCICGLLPSLPTRTHVAFVMHAIEAKKTTNTGRIAAMCLRSSTTHLYGGPGEPKPVRPWPDDHEPILLYPHDGALPVDRLPKQDKPYALIVPDGTWQQAKKARRRIEGLESLRCVVVPPLSRSPRRLRSETKDEGLSTIEAVAYCLGALEGAHVRDALLSVWRVMVDRTLWTRGVLADADVEGGLPAGAQRHDPLSGELVASDRRDA